MGRPLCLLALSLTLATRANAQELRFPEAAAADASALSRAMPELARQALAVYRDEDRERYLNNLFRLQIAPATSRTAAAASC